MNRPRPLQRCHFRKVAGQGFDGGFNHYAYSCAWFQDRLYIGTVRNVMALMIMQWPFDFPSSFLPVPVPKDMKELDLRGQIWRYDVDRNRWTRVFRSPLTEGLGGRQIPLSIAFRSMVVFQGESDPEPALYAVPTVGRFAARSYLLRSLDGETFGEVPGASLPEETVRYGSFRAIIGHNGWLFAAPSHVLMDPDTLDIQGTVPEVTVRCTRDPVQGNWQNSCEPSFGDLTNVNVYEMLTCGEYVYACTMNVRRGFQLWRTRGDTDPPHRWELVLRDGAFRGPLNEAPISGAVLDGDLYIGTGIQNGGNDRVHHVGPDAFEIIRVHPDKSWDLVVGQPRMTPDGFKAPVSGFGPGFDNLCNGYCWRMCTHEGVLYAGSFNYIGFLRFVDRSLWPEAMQRIVDDAFVDAFVKFRGGTELWASADGDNWQPVTINGFDNPNNYGIRSLISTPHGLFVGTANPFGPRVADKDEAGIRFVDNPQGGLEIWHGSLSHRGSYGEPDVEGSWTPDALVGEAERDSRWREAIPSLVPYRDFGKQAGEAIEEYSMQVEEATVECGWRANPLLRLAVNDKDLIPPAISVSEEVDQYFLGAAIRNAGHWAREPDGPAEAARRLVRLLCDLYPAGDETEPSPPRSVLALAVGGEEVAALLRDVWGEALHVRVISPDPLGGSVPAVPDEPAGREVVLWVEGPSRGCRADGLRAVRRALAPGGCLLAADLVAAMPDAGETPPSRDRLIDALRLDLEAAGFAHARIVDVGSSGWERFQLHSRYHVMTRAMLHLMDPELVQPVLEALPGGDRPIAANLLIYAENPR